MYDVTALKIKDPKNRERLQRFATDDRFRIENLYHILAAKTRKIIPLRFNEAQIHLYRKYRKQRDRRQPVRLIICKSRRAGLSTGVMALMYDDMCVHPNTRCLIIANEKNPSENVLDMARTMWFYTPQTLEVEGYTFKLRPDLPPEFRNNPPKDKLFLADPPGSRMYLASSKSLDSYLSFGFQNIHATEAGHYPDGARLFLQIQPTLVNEAHSALYIESTPNGMDGPGQWFYHQVLAAHERKGTEYGQLELVFIPWHEMRVSFSIPFEDISKRSAFERSLTKEEQDVIKRFPHVSLEQMLWYRTVRAGPAFNNNPEVFDEAFPSDLATAFLMSGESVYPRAAIKRLMANSVRPPIWEGDVYWGESDEANKHLPIHETIRTPVFLEMWQAKAQGRASHVNNGAWKNLKVYRWPKEGERLLIACDVASGLRHTRDGDLSTIVVGVLNELSRDEVIMTWRGRLNELLFAEVCCALAWSLRKMVGEKVAAPQLIPEWTGPGRALCIYIDKKQLYAPVYLYEFPGKQGMPASKHLGHETNDKTKPFMVSSSVRMVEGDTIDVPDERLVLEMSGYQKHGQGGYAEDYGGSGGKHDDMVSAFQILCMHLRLRAATIPGEAEVLEPQQSFFDTADDEETSWDPFGPTSHAYIPGLSRRDAGEENLTEGLFWSS